MEETVQKVKIWVTKWALTQGVWTYLADIDGKMAVVDCRGLGYPNMHFHKPYWHLSEQEAMDHVEILRAKKIKSLTKQLDEVRTREIRIFDKTEGDLL